MPLSPAVGGLDGDLVSNSVPSGEVGCFCDWDLVNVSATAGRDRGLDRPEEELLVGWFVPAILRRSSVALRRASRASSSEVWVFTTFFLRYRSVSLLGVDCMVHTSRRPWHRDPRDCHLS